MSSEVAHRSQLAERQALLEALTKDKEQLEADLKTATLASTAAREDVRACFVAYFEGNSLSLLWL